MTPMTMSAMIISKLLFDSLGRSHPSATRRPGKSAFRSSGGPRSGCLIQLNGEGAGNSLWIAGFWRRLCR